MYDEPHTCPGTGDLIVQGAEKEEKEVTHYGD
jgi:hypothetical protein